MYNKCSIENCRSKRKFVKLHSFPTYKPLTQKWLECIGSARLSSLSKHKLLKEFVCHKHFEPRFHILSSKLHEEAYPTLFTAEEKTTGVPDNIFKNQERDSTEKYEVRKFSNLKVYSSKKKMPEKDNSESTLCMEKQPDTSPREYPDPEKKVFSWQQTDDIYVDNSDSSLYMEKQPDTSLGQEPGSDDQEVPTLKGYVCNYCKETITKFVYKCVQCYDYDLCSLCEKAGRHYNHFLLRVPEHKASDEVQSVLEKIRKDLVHSEPVLLRPDQVKKERKDDCDDESTESSDSSSETDAETELRKDNDVLVQDTSNKNDCTADAAIQEKVASKDVTMDINDESMNGNAFKYEIFTDEDTRTTTLKRVTNVSSDLQLYDSICIDSSSDEDLQTTCPQTFHRSTKRRKTPTERPVMLVRSSKHSIKDLNTFTQNECHVALQRLDAKNLTTYRIRGLDF